MIDVGDLKSEKDDFAGLWRRRLKERWFLSRGWEQGRSRLAGKDDRPVLDMLNLRCL